MKYSICIETIFPHLSLEKRFELCAEAGIEYIEFWTWKDKDLEQIKKLCQTYSIKIASFSGDHEYSMIDRKESEDYVRFLKESIEVAKYLDCKHLVVHSDALMEDGSAKKIDREISDIEKFISMYEVLREIAPVIEKEDVKLVLEPLNTTVDHRGYFLDNTREAVELIKLVGSSHIKILYDIYHMQIMEGNIIETIRNNYDYIGYIHVADVPGRQEPGTGEINYSNIIATLSSMNYRGIVGLELFPSQKCINVTNIFGTLK